MEKIMREHTTLMKSGITRTKEFERKQLASFAVNVGTKCGHDCRYCSTGALMRMHHSFKIANESPFGHGYSIVDPTTPIRVAYDAQHCHSRDIDKRGMIQLCTIVDAWAPEAQKYGLGHRCLEAILSQPGWTVRILTKNAAVANDLPLIEKYRDRVLVGMSITALPSKDKLISVVEPNASPISERIAVMHEAHKRGLRTYGMFCPLLPGIADSPNDIHEMLSLAVEWGCEEVFVEPVNPRAKGLISTAKTLASHGYATEAQAIHQIRQQKNWSVYVVNLLKNVQEAVRQLYDINRLRFLLYSKNLHPVCLRQIKSDDAGVIWL